MSTCGGSSSPSCGPLARLFEAPLPRTTTVHPDSDCSRCCVFPRGPMIRPTRLSAPPGHASFGRKTLVLKGPRPETTVPDPAPNLAATSCFTRSFRAVSSASFSAGAIGPASRRLISSTRAWSVTAGSGAGAGTTAVGVSTLPPHRFRRRFARAYSFFSASATSLGSHFVCGAAMESRGARLVPASPPRGAARQHRVPRGGAGPTRTADGARTRRRRMHASHGSAGPADAQLSELHALLSRCTLDVSQVSIVHRSLCENCDLASVAAAGSSQPALLVWLREALGERGPRSMTERESVLSLLTHLLHHRPAPALTRDALACRVLAPHLRLGSRAKGACSELVLDAVAQLVGGTTNRPPPRPAAADPSSVPADFARENEPLSPAPLVALLSSLIESLITRDEESEARAARCIRAVVQLLTSAAQQQQQHNSNDLHAALRSLDLAAAQWRVLPFACQARAPHDPAASPPHPGLAMRHPSSSSLSLLSRWRRSPGGCARVVPRAAAQRRLHEAAVRRTALH